ncbi:MAG TPA: glycosyltransferase 87 family protein, partial [Candidatus Limnocylindrales bacterium]
MQALSSSPLVRRLLRDGYIILAVVFVLLRLFEVPPWDRAIDAFAYWTTRDGSMYDGSLAGTLGAYLYTPAFAQILAPLVALPWALFIAIWTAILLAAYGWTVRLAALPLLLFLPIPADIATGNVHLLFAAAIVAGFRYPATWALLALTKVTPFIGVLWFAARREWRSLAI